MPRSRNPRCAMDIDPYVALFRDKGLAGVQPHPHPDWAVSKRIAGCRGSRERVGGLRKGDEESVTLSVHLDTAVPRKRVTQGAPVLGQRTRILITELLQQPSRALDIGEEERDGAGRQLGHPGIMRRPREKV